MQDVEVDLFGKLMDDRQKEELCRIAESCRCVLVEIEAMIANYTELGFSSDRKGKSVKRAWKRLRWEPADVLDLRSRLISNVGLLNAFNVQITHKSLAKLVRHQDNQERQTILDWLSPMTYGAKQHDYISRRQPGTGQWLLDSSELQDWLIKPKQTLFCPGVPGAGKTIFSSVLIDELQLLYGHRCDISVAFIYCNFQRQEEQSSESLLANLLRQLVHSEGPLPECLKLLYEHHIINGSRPTIDEIDHNLHLAAQGYSRLFIVIDALDECSASNMSPLLDKIFNLQTKHNLSFLVTSRFIPEIAVRFHHWPSLEISASNSDMMTYLSANLNKLPSFVSRSPDLQREIVRSITDAARGVFLLAQLFVESLVGKRSPKAIRSVLKDLSNGPKTYDSAYHDVMQRIEGQVPDRVELAKQVLMWITCAKRELTALELQTALAVELGETCFDDDNLSDQMDMVSVCAGLVTIDEQSQIIRLVHFTTQEYFQRTWTNWFPSSHLHIANTCLTYLLYDCFSDGPDPTDRGFEVQLIKYPLFSYAAGYWGHHAKEQSIDEDLALNLFNHVPKLEACVQGTFSEKRAPGHFGHSQEGPKRMTGLHLAAYFGLENLVERLIQSGNQCDIKDSFGLTPLSWAAASHHEAVVKLLLDAGADPDSSDMHGRTPLSRAAFSKSKHNQAFPIGETTSSPEEVVKSLLRSGTKFESKDEHGRTPLAWAALAGRDAIVKLLLEAGADPGSRGEDGRSPLSRAALNGHGIVVQLLYEKGADPDISDGQGRTPLSCAASNGHAAMIRSLLEKGANPHSKDEDGRTALLRAASCGHEKVVKILLEMGADPNSEDEDGRTPLSGAAASGHSKVVNVLINMGALPDHRNQDGRTPLSMTASGGCEEGAKALLDAGFDPDSRDNHRRTPLSWAASSGKEALVRLLLDIGADPMCEDEFGRTPLSWAASAGHEEVVKTLLEAGVDPDHTDKNGRTALLWATYTGKHSVAKLLLDSGANPESMDKHGRTSLSWATLKNQKTTVKLLLDYGAKLGAQCQHGCASVSLTTDHGLEEVTALLTGKGAGLDINEKEVTNHSIIIRVER